MTVAELADVIESLGNHRITITGGEPLLQEAAVVELIDELNRRKALKIQDNPSSQSDLTRINDVDKRERPNNSPYDFNIETNGTIVPSFHRDNVWFTYDYKTPSSLAEESMNIDIYKVATERD